MSEVAEVRELPSGRQSLDGIETGDTCVRLACDGDIDGIRAIEAKPEYREFLGMWSDQEYQAAIADAMQEVAVAVGAHGSVKGFYVLRDLQGKDRSVNLMRIAVQVQGGGLGSRLMRCAMRRAFEVHKAHRLWLDVFTTNQRAQRVYRRLGFIQEGVLRDVKLRYSRFQSQIILSMLEDEYRGSER